jgi:hypothetical protein
MALNALSSFISKTSGHVETHNPHPIHVSASIFAFIFSPFYIFSITKIHPEACGKVIFVLMRGNGIIVRHENFRAHI